MTKAMRIASFVCITLAALLAVFAWWGLFTAAGRHAYDEMDGLIPFGAGLLAAALAVCAAVAWWLGKARPHATRAATARTSRVPGSPC